MSTQFEPALAAAIAACAHQDTPPGVLYVVATPIGNLADITLRALAVLHHVTAIACEDTRHTGQLLRAYGFPVKPLLAVHQHNEAQAALDVVSRLQQGHTVAYVSDAGTPGISDPGARLVLQAQRAGFRVMPIPGASSPIAALSAAGVIPPTGFTFYGFLPSGATERQKILQWAFTEPRAVIFFEAPHRIATLAKEIASIAGADAPASTNHNRSLTIARELTKQFEHIQTLPATQWPALIESDPNASRGEFVIVLHPQPAAEGPSPVDTRVLALLLKELPVKTATKLAAEITGQSKNALYEQALVLKAGD